MRHSSALRLLATFDPSLANEQALLCLRHIIEIAVTRYAARTDFNGEPIIFPPNQRIDPLVEMAFGKPALDRRGESSLRISALLGMRLESVLADVIAKMREMNTDVRVLKGMATSRLDYPIREWRQFGDIDLLVRAQQMEAVEIALADLGFRRFKYPPRYQPEVMDKGVTLVGPGGAEIDLHTRLFKPAFQEATSMFSRPVETAEGYPCMPAEARLVHAAGHLLLTPSGHRRLSSLIDCSMILRRTGVDSKQACDLARQWGIGSVFRTAMELEAQVAGSPNGTESYVGPNELFPDALSVAYLGKRRRPALEVLVRMRQIPTAAWIPFLRSSAAGHFQ